MSKYNINLEQNGRIFPLWIMQNFKKFILPKINIVEGQDPCNEKREEGLTLYQQFIGQYLNYESPFKDILIYHGVGSGKTNTAINIYNILFNYTPEWNIFLLIKASLHDDPWLKDLNRWMKKDNFEKRFANIYFIHYDSPFADRDFLEKIKKTDANNQSIFIIDEVHQFITNVYNNISSKKGKRAQVIYDYIQQEKRENINTRVILLSATPVVNNPFEFALIFNLLKPDIFPSSEAIFQQIFISSSNFASLNENTKNMFQRRILSLVSYYIGSTPDKFAEKILHYVKIPMEEYYEEIYNFYENIEEKIEKNMLKMFRGKVGDRPSSYSSYTRQACNFIFPYISDKVNGETRPRPSKYNIKDTEAELIDEGKNLKKKKELIKSNNNVLEYLKDIRIFINTFIEYLKNIKSKNDPEKSLTDDIKLFKNKYDENFENFIKSDEKKSKLFLAMYKSSPKFIRIIFNILLTKGTVLIYSNYVEMEGLQLLKVYLNFFGFISIDQDSEFNKDDLNINNKLKKDGYRFCEFHGGITKDIRKINKNIFNKSDNKYGQFCKIIMISSAGAEGINLHNVRQVHIMEPYWNEVRIEQVIGRALRFCQHKDLPMNERKVDIFRYNMIRNSKKITTDEKLENISRKKNNLLLSFTEAVKEAAIDCELFKEHNMMGSKYKCFQFNEESLFEKPISNAYQLKLEYDQKNDNGLNAKDSNILRIKVRKIKAVKIIDDNSYSSEECYWLNDETCIVYDFDLNYPVGKLSKDNNNNFILLENDIYIISEIIDIPNFKIYD
jgi:superfamily II DNA or RNA helicase